MDYTNWPKNSLEQGINCTNFTHLPTSKYDYSRPGTMRRHETHIHAVDTLTESQLDTAIFQGSCWVGWDHSELYSFRFGAPTLFQSMWGWRKGGTVIMIVENSKGSLSVTFFLVNFFERVYYIYTRQEAGIRELQYKEMTSKWWDRAGVRDREKRVERPNSWT
jgi:hypothetical protein